MPRLYDKVLAGQALWSTAPHEGSFSPELAVALRGLTVIVADNVAEMTLSERSGWDPVKDFPNVAPPLDRFWIEARRPAGEWCSVDHGTKEAGISSWGAYVETINAPDAPEWSEARWTTRFTFFQDLHAFGRRAVMGPTGSLTLAVGAGGEVLRYHFASAVGKHWDGDLSQLGRELNTSLSDSDWHREALRLAAPLLVAVCFMHCKNVERRGVEQPMFDRQVWRKKHKRPLVRYHVLDIDPMRKVLKSEGRSDEVGLKKALHICRGHFATYTEDAPLFGRVTGTFWKPQHIRGSKKQGLVVKDYRVRAPRNQ